jgi:hypothetical protein
MPAASDLRALVGVSPSEAADGDLDGYLSVAAALVDEHLTGGEAADAVPYTVPDAVLDRAYLLVAAEMFNQDQAPNGILNQQYEVEGGGTVSAPVRLSADPMRLAYALLSRWVPPVTIG